jgi:metal-dependent amidase/aminoacylase/carboxypeptidase family protein
MKHVIDPVAVAGELITGTRRLIGEQPDPPNAVLAITHVETLAKPSFNVIPSTLLLQGSLREVRIAVYNELVQGLEALLRKLEAQFRCRIELDFSAYYPSLLNDAGVHHVLGAVQEKIFGQANVSVGQAYLIGEDFSFFSRAMPAQFYLLGAKTEENEAFFLHHPKVTFNEDCIKYGTPLLAEGALQLLQTYRS